MKEGDRVRLVTPDNPALDGAAATVARVTDWGAHVWTEVAATGRFRALSAEMVPLAGQNDAAKVNAAPGAASGVRAKDLGYTGDACDQCGGFRMRRGGACLLCEDCGKSSGCG